MTTPDTAEPVAAAADMALAVFADMERECSRFRPSSALARCNALPRAWHRVPAVLLGAVEQARLAHHETGGAFDPRVHDRLVELGYDRSFAAGVGPGGTGAATGVAPRPQGTWRPRVARRLGMLNLGGHRIDLGGIGKGLALRSAAELMRAATGDFLLEAGGDLITSGSPGDGGWLIGVEAPDGSDGPIAVLELSGTAVATSSVRVRQWTAAGRNLHHLIDPRTGDPGGDGLLSVTVVAPDPAWAEVWSKALFLAGQDGIGRLASDRGLAAMWVDRSGTTAVSPTMEPYVTWVRR